jgi:hypothetical protein
VKYSLPYSHLNLCRNPFGELTRSERASVAIVDPSPWLEKIANRCFAVLFIGEAGRGKTTHLLAIHRHFPDAPYLHIVEGEKPPVPRGRPLFLDEVQRLPARRRRREFGRGGPLVLGTHDDVADELRGMGYDVETVFVARKTDAQRIADVIGQRIESARRAPGPLPGVTAATIARLFEEFGDNVRGIEHYLYEVFQTLKEVQDV